MKRRLFVGILLLLALGFAALGVWQIERRAWKLELIESTNPSWRDLWNDLLD